MLTPESFDQLLTWLNTDRDQAGQKYKKLHVRLIKIFTCRGCIDPEQLADDVIDRVASKIMWLASNYEGAPEPYFYGVARRVYLEYSRRSRRTELPELTTDTATNATLEQDYSCLDQCLDGLPAPERRLVLEYHQEDKHAKIENRKRLAQGQGISVNALRIRICRIHSHLQQCVHLCLEQLPAQ